MPDFEQKLQQMIPLIREPFVCQTQPKGIRRELHWCELHGKSFAKIVFGFVLGVFVTYNMMLPNDSPQKTKPQATFAVRFDETELQQVRCPADIFRCTVRVPIQVPKDEQTQWQYGKLREQLLR
jgi:hypothetical protein